jgi:hypothetical protein
MELTTSVRFRDGSDLIIYLGLEKIVVPVNSNDHWYLIVAFIPERCIK